MLKYFRASVLKRKNALCLTKKKTFIKVSIYGAPLTFSYLLLQGGMAVISGGKLNTSRMSLLRCKSHYSMIQTGRLAKHDSYIGQYKETLTFKALLYLNVAVHA